MIVICFKTSALRIGSLHLTYSAVLCWIRLRGMVLTLDYFYIIFCSFPFPRRLKVTTSKGLKGNCDNRNICYKKLLIEQNFKKVPFNLFKFWTHACNVLHCFNISILLLNSPCMRSCSYLASWSEGDDFLTPTNQTCSLVKREMIGPCHTFQNGLKNHERLH